MATQSLKSSKTGDSKYEVRPAGSFGSDKTQAIMNGGTGSKGVSNDQLKKLGRGLARAAGSGKAY